MQISTFENEMEVLGFYLLKSFDVKTGKTNKQYIDISLEDKTGQISAKIWNTEGIDPEEYKEAIAVKVKGKAREYNGALQLNVEKIRPVNDKDGVDLDELVASAPLDGQDMFDRIIKYAESIPNPDLKKLTLHLFNKHREKLLYYPAAKSNHHSIRSGLLFHVLKMLEVSTELCRIYENIDRGLLYTGVILHDIAKLEEMNAGVLGIVTEYSIPGELLGHITLGVNMVFEAGRELGLDPEAVMLTAHMILSHHYEPEYGSPKKPCILEAEILHYVDMMDARVFDMGRATKDLAGGTFSEPVFSIDKRKIYKPGI